MYLNKNYSLVLKSTTGTNIVSMILISGRRVVSYTYLENVFVVQIVNSSRTNHFSTNCEFFQKCQQKIGEILRSVTRTHRYGPWYRTVMILISNLKAMLKRFKLSRIK